jgi:dihydrofolate reductase
MQDRTKEFAMRKVVVSEFVSLDGVMEAPDQWHNPYWNDEMVKYKSDELAAADALLLGRTTYEVFAAAWPSMTDEEGGAEMNGYPKHVVSTTLQESLGWNNSTLMKGDVGEEVEELKQQEGKDILVFGSAQLVRKLMEHDRIDEYRLMVFPIIVGKGKHLFEDGEDGRILELVNSKTFGTGVVSLAYRLETS